MAPTPKKDAILEELVEKILKGTPIDWRRLDNVSNKNLTWLRDSILKAIKQAK